MGIVAQKFLKGNQKNKKQIKSNEKKQAPWHFHCLDSKQTKKKCLELIERTLW